MDGIIRTVEYRSAEVRSNIELAPGHWLIELAVEMPLPDICAGQFLSLRCDPADRHSLLRPFSILAADGGRGIISVYYKHLGRLSTQLSAAQPGTELDCLYPLGHGFPWREDWKRVALVGGGVGLAPLLYMAQQLQAMHNGVDVQCFFGGASEADLVPRLLERYQLPMQLATMDGSAGFKGTVVDLFRQSEPEAYAALYTCGPNPMMAALAPVAGPDCASFASLEEYMACGVGACYGCTAHIQEEGQQRNLRVCCDGPVFDLKRVVFTA